MARMEAEEGPSVEEPAAESVFTYEISNGQVTITGLSASCPRNLIIPSALGGYPVTSIGEFAFSGCSELTYVVLPSTLQSMGESVFWNCSALTSVTFLGMPPAASNDPFGCETLESNDPYWNNPIKGYYPVKYAAEWAAVIGSNGFWHGLAMAREGVLDWPYTLSAGGTITITGLPENFTGTELVIPSVIDGY